MLASPRARTYGSEVDVVQMCREDRTKDSDLGCGFVGAGESLDER